MNTLRTALLAMMLLVLFRYWKELLSSSLGEGIKFNLLVKNSNFSHTVELDFRPKFT